MDKVIQAISETLAKLGLDEDTIKAATQEIISKVGSSESSEEGAPSDVNPPAQPVEEEVLPIEPEASAGPQEEIPSEESIPSDTVPTAPTGDEVPPVEEQPPLPPTPEVPPFDPTELLAKLDELSKANEGLMARVQSLEDALKQAGVVDEQSQSQVGDETPNVPGQPSDSDIFNEQLKLLNGRKTY